MDSSLARERPEPREAPSRSGPLSQLLVEALAWAREREYTGWDYCDGMSSHLRQYLPDNRWINLALQETVKRAPVNVRPLLAVEQRRNFMGAALFAVANLNVARLQGARRAPEDEVDYLAETERLCEWLLDTQRAGYRGFCGGHNHQIQHLSSRGLPEHPDVVSTAYGTRALLAASGIEDRYRRVAETAREFLIEEMNYREVEEGAEIDYYVTQPEDLFVTNAAALGARTLLDIHSVSPDPRLQRRARLILDRVADLQEADGGWEYTDPPGKSRLSKDSHHNGFVLESFLRYREVVGDGRYDDVLGAGMEFYRSLFEADGAPDFDESSTYPRDAHAAAQGVLTFTYAGEYEAAERVIGWTIEHMLDDDEPRFYYRKGRLITKRFTLMRWCQAWLCYAISEYLVHTRIRENGVDLPASLPGE